MLAPADRGLWIGAIEQGRYKGDGSPTTPSPRSLFWRLFQRLRYEWPDEGCKNTLNCSSLHVSCAVIHTATTLAVHKGPLLNPTQLQHPKLFEPWTILPPISNYRVAQTGPKNRAPVVSSGL